MTTSQEDPRSFAYSDLVLAALTGLAYLAILLGNVGNPVRFVCAAAYYGWGFGYSFVAALFPRLPTASTTTSGRAPDGYERHGLAFVLGVVTILPLLFAVFLVTGSVSLVTGAVATIGASAAALTWAAWGRAQLDPQDRMRFRSTWLSLRMFRDRSRRIFLAVCVATIGALAVAWLLVVYGSGEAPKTEFFLLDQDGHSFGSEDLAGSGEEQRVIVGLRNVEPALGRVRIVTTLEASNGTRTTLASSEISFSETENRLIPVSFVAPPDGYRIAWDLFAENTVAPLRTISIVYERT